MITYKKPEKVDLGLRIEDDIKEAHRSGNSAYIDCIMIGYRGHAFDVSIRVKPISPSEKTVEDCGLVLIDDMELG